MRKAQLAKAYGEVFDVPGVVNGSARVRFVGVWPTGNVGVKRETDPDTFGALTVSPEKAQPLMQAIDRRYPAK
jgi:hypothetical protein